MQTTSSDIAARKEAYEKRLEAHRLWKKEFFQSRPPPQPLGRLHRSPEPLKKGVGVGCAMKRARELIREEGSSSKAVRPEAVLVSSTPKEELDEKRAQWIAQLSGELIQWNPLLDVKILSDPRRTVIMANLHPETVENELQSFANQFGRVTSLRIIRNAKTGRSKRYAFVEFGLVGEASQAVSFSQKKRLKGHAIIIDFEKGRQPNFLPKRLSAVKDFLPKANGTGANPEGDGKVVKDAKQQEMDDILNSLLDD
ncbi:U1 small nuclear ribonucleoprotein 70kDa [Angomonas deanei]|nr:U1 small nuclear ribonucleoprotein 70kDa [Angomonas deanei]|eukprot:EPY39758.1 U1 small nuclear ribonucleoprotein 70kDa [Angomonas deanei]